jgi:hypothetical protein
VLGKISVLKMAKIINQFRILHKEELSDLQKCGIVRIVEYRRLKCISHVARMGETMNAYRNLMGKLLRKRPIGRPRKR